jgi:4-aminobutyrate aminotransferase-like enzyme
MRAALATLNVIERDQLMQNALVMGERLRAGLEALQEEFPFIGDVRGKGLMQGLEFVRDDKKPAPDLVLRFFEATKARGLLLGKGGLWANTVRIAPALTVTTSQVSEALGTMREAFTELVQKDPELALVQRTH